MFGLYAMDGTQPFDVVALHGMVRDQHGKKMSKSFANVVDPLDWIDRFGAGRHPVHPGPGRQPGRGRAGLRGVVARAPATSAQAVERDPFALMNGSHTNGPLPRRSSCPLDRWICPAGARERRGGPAVRRVPSWPRSATPSTHFAWDDVLRLVRRAEQPVIRDSGPASGCSARPGSAAAPVAPGDPVRHEELWIALTGRESVVVADWPAPDKAYLDDPAELEIATLQKVVNRGPPVPLRPGAQAGPAGRRRLAGLAGGGLAGHEPLIRSLARLDEAGAGFAATANAGRHRGVRGGDRPGARSMSPERARLEKDRAVAGRSGRRGGEARQQRVPGQGAGSGVARSRLGWPP